MLPLKESPVMSLKSIGLSAILALGAAAAQAAPVSPVSYDMLNGGSGSFSYRDDTYNGSGNVNLNYTSLTGGTGDLTDGVIASGNWNVTGQTALYVGWFNFNPTITFNFAQSYDFTSATFHFDDSEGAGGVSQPGSVTINGTNVAVPTNPGRAPFSFTFDLTGTSTDTLTAQIFRNNQWMMLSEVTFEANVPAVPVPAAGGLLLMGVAGFAALRRRPARG